MDSGRADAVAAGGDRAPQLRAGGYAVWKPAMDVYLQRHGAANVHKEPLTESEWKQDCSDVAAWSSEALAAARARARAASSVKSAPTTVLTAEDKADRLLVTAHVERSHKAFGSIYSALSEDMRLQVAHLPQGWAYGLWMWLERKFQSTEADSVGVLLTRWVSLAQTEDESFDQYRARVNELAALLEHAKQKQTPEMYCLFLLKRLQPRYTSAVLALENGVMLKTLAAGTVDWDAVTALINNHERSERQFAEAAASGAKAMAAQSASSGTSSSHARGRSPVPQDRRSREDGNSQRERTGFVPMTERRCFNCDKLGHISAFCPTPRRNGAGAAGAGGGRKNEKAESVQSGGAVKPGKKQDQACGVRHVMKVVRNAPVDPDGWMRVQRKSRGKAAGSKKGQESFGAKQPASNPGERQRGVTPAVSSASPVRGCQSAVGALAHPQPQAAVKNGVNASSSSSCTEASALVVPAVKLTAASPASSKKKTVSFNMRVSAITALPREFGVDSMASLHVVGCKALFHRGLRSCKPFTVTVANGDEVTISQVGSIELHVDVAPGHTATFVVDDVYFHPKFKSNLLSLHGLTEKGWKFSSGKEETFLLTPDELKVRLRKENRVSVLRCSGGAGQHKVYSVAALVWDSAADLVRLHERLGHMGFDRMLRIIKADSTEGIGRLNTSVAVLQEARGRVLECRACAQGKGTRTAFGRRGLDKGAAPGETLHMDLYHHRYERADGTSCVEYGLTVSCPYTTHRWTPRLGSKDEAAAEVIHIIKQAQTQFECKVKRLYADGGGEFLNRTLLPFCAKEGIEWHNSPAGTPQLNAVAESQVRSGKNGGRTLLMHAGLPARFSALAVQHHNYVWNRTNVAQATGKTPFEAMRKRKPSVLHVGIFGCDVYYHVPRTHRGAFDAKMLPGIYLGHNSVQDCAVVYDLRSGRELLTRDVKYLTSFTNAAALSAGGAQLQEAQAAEPGQGSAARSSRGVFDVERILGKRVVAGQTEYHVKWLDYEEAQASWEPAENVDVSASEKVDEFEAALAAAGTDELAATLPPAQSGAADEDAGAEAEQDSEQSAPAAVESAPTAAMPTIHAPAPAAAAAEPVQPAPARQPKRSPRSHPSSTSLDAGQQHVRMAMSVVSSAQPGGDVRLDDADSYLMSAVATGLAELDTDKAPATYKEAMQSPQAALWREAADKEMAGCEKKMVWELVPRTSVPKEHRVISCKWVLKVKTDSNGAVDVFKARITPKGFQQREGINFFETFAATGKYKSLRLGLAITAVCGHHLEQMDVPQAFLNADVDEEVYMELPEGYREGKQHLVCRLKKALYGLKQSPRNWYLLIRQFVRSELKFQATVSDPCLFFRRSRTGRLMLLFLFVDDFQASYHSEDKAEWNECKAKLVARFDTKDLGESTWILGMRITRDLKARTITLDQEQHLTKALRRFGMAESKVVPTPGVPGGASAEAVAEELGPVDVQLYQEMVGTLMYSAVSCRPDIAHAVQKLSQAMQAPTQQDVLAAKRVFRYLAGAKDIGLVFGSRCSQLQDTRGRRNPFRLEVCAFADADWANDKSDRKSITGWVAKVNGDPISWASKKQRTVAQSTCEAELYAEAAAMQEVLWLRGLLAELGLHTQTGSLVYGDNQSTLAISTNGIKGERTKHVDVKYHFITETVERGDVKLKWIPTTEQQADIFTKPLAAPAFQHLRQLLMTR
jgi:hypothetical protein